MNPFSDYYLTSGTMADASEYGTFSPDFINFRSAMQKRQSYYSSKDCMMTCIVCGVGVLLLIIFGLCIGPDIAIIIIGAQHMNTNNYDRLADWLIRFGSAELAIICLAAIVCSIIICVKSEECTEYKLVSSFAQIIWGIVVFTMLIMGIIELVHVFPTCIVEEYVLSITVLVTIILKLVTMCGTITYVKCK